NASPCHIANIIRFNFDWRHSTYSTILHGVRRTLTSSLVLRSLEHPQTLRIRGLVSLALQRSRCVRFNWVSSIRSKAYLGSQVSTIAPACVVNQGTGWTGGC